MSEPRIRAETPRLVRLRKVIEVIALRGAGTTEDMAREVRQYYSLKGELLAEYDPEDGFVQLSWDIPASAVNCSYCKGPVTEPARLGCVFPLGHKQEVSGG